MINFIDNAVDWVSWAGIFPSPIEPGPYSGHGSTLYGLDVSFLCVVKSQRRWSNKIYKTELTKIRYKNQVLCKYRVDAQRAGLTLIAELTWSNLGLKGGFKK